MHFILQSVKLDVDLTTSAIAGRTSLVVAQNEQDCGPGSSSVRLHCRQLQIQEVGIVTCTLHSLSS